MTMGPEDDPLAAEISADFERKHRIAAIANLDEIVTIGIYLDASHRLRRPVNMDQFSAVFDFEELQDRLHVTEPELLEAIAISFDRLRERHDHGDKA